MSINSYNTCFGAYNWKQMTDEIQRYEFLTVLQFHTKMYIYMSFQQSNYICIDKMLIETNCNFQKWFITLLIRKTL